MVNEIKTIEDRKKSLIKKYFMQYLSYIKQKKMKRQSSMGIFQ